MNTIAQKIIRHLLRMILIMFFVITLTFFLLKLTPGSAFDQEINFSNETKLSLKKTYNQDKNYLSQYTNYLRNLLNANLGFSIKYPNKTVVQLLKERLPLSLKLGFFSTIMALLGGILLGLLGSLKPNSFLDNFTAIVSTLGICCPPFVIGPLLILIFGIKFRLFSVVGYSSSADFVLPCLTQSYLSMAYITKLTKTHIYEILQTHYIRTAYSKGLSYNKIFFSHILKNAIPSTLVYFGPTAAAFFSGSLIVETLFHLPGAGSLFIQSIYYRDDNVILATVLLFSFFVIIFNSIVDFVLFLLHSRSDFSLKR